MPFVQLMGCRVPRIPPQSGLSIPVSSPPRHGHRGSLFPSPFSAADTGTSRVGGSAARRLGASPPPPSLPTETMLPRCVECGAHVWPAPPSPRRCRRHRAMIYGHVRATTGAGTVLRRRACGWPGRPARVDSDWPGRDRGCRGDVTQRWRGQSATNGRRCGRWRLMAHRGTGVPPPARHLFP